MIRISRIIKELKEGRCKLNNILIKNEYVIAKGETYNEFYKKINDSISNCLFVEQYLRLSVSNSCKILDGFDAGKMDPVDYISSSDVKNKVIDISRGRSLVAFIDLNTGKIIQVDKLDIKEEGEQKS